METLQLVIQILASVAGCLAALTSITLFLQLRWPAPALWFLKLYVSALSPLFALVGVFSTVVGLTRDSTFISVIGTSNDLNTSLQNGKF